jgi:hypothetical protein
LPERRTTFFSTLPLVLRISEDRRHGVRRRGQLIANTPQLSLETYGFIFENEEHIEVTIWMVISSCFGAIDDQTGNDSRMLLLEYLTICIKPILFV